MNNRKISQRPSKGKMMMREEYDHYLSLDWSKTVMAIAHMTRRSHEPRIFERESNLAEMKQYLASVPGRKILAIEETTTSQWLYVELRECVDKILFCDPYRNRLLSDGPKTDKIDAGKLCLLLRAGLLKEVYHSTSELYALRQLISAYEDVVKTGVQFQNQKKSFEQGHFEAGAHAPFILEHIEHHLDQYQRIKKEYEKKFSEICSKNKSLKHLIKVTGIGEIGAVKILAIVVDAKRFPSAGHYYSYCGLVKHEKISGQRSYGRRRPRFNHTLKAVYKVAAMAALSGTSNPMRIYYDELLKRGVAEHDARNAVARYIARLTYGMLKTGTPYRPYARMKKQAA
jgi:transposase